MRFLFRTLVVCLTIGHLSCSQTEAKNRGSEYETLFNKESKKPLLECLFDSLLTDGFSFPFGNGKGGGTYTGLKDKKHYDGWYIATHTAEKYQLGIHTGEDWNGKGGGDTDFGQPVFATAKGLVLAAKDYGAPWGNVVYIEHHYIENTRLITVYSLYAHLDRIDVKQGSVISRRQQIGTIGTGHNSFPAHLHFEIRKESMKDFEVTYWPSSNNKDENWVLENYYKPSDFINAHLVTSVPSSYDTLLVAQKSNYKMYLYAKGKKIKEYDIALSQNPIGHKEVEGDNRLPEGEYYITEKSKGPFSGNYKAYFGPGWMRISYPNTYDAIAGFKKGIIDEKKRDAIIAANKKGLQPPKNTGLGGGIGIHGWAGDWPASTKDLTWGCISFRNKDLEKFYSEIPVHTKLFILP